MLQSNYIALLTVIYLAIDIYADPNPSDYCICFTTRSRMTHFCYNVFLSYPSPFLKVLNIIYFHCRQFLLFSSGIHISVLLIENRESTFRNIFTYRIQIVHYRLLHNVYTKYVYIRLPHTYVSLFSVLERAWSPGNSRQNGRKFVCSMNFSEVYYRSYLFKTQSDISFKMSRNIYAIKNFLSVIRMCL